MTPSHVKLIKGAKASVVGGSCSPLEAATSSSASFRSHRHRHSAGRVSTSSSLSSAAVLHPTTFSLPHSTFYSPPELIPNSTSASVAPVSISLLVNEMLVYIRELQATSAVALQSPFSGSRRKASLIRVLGRIRDTVTAGVGSAHEQSRWAACWNEEDSALYLAMVKALERMVLSRSGGGGVRGGLVTDAHLIGVLKAQCPPLPAARRTSALAEMVMEE